MIPRRPRLNNTLSRVLLLVIILSSPWWAGNAGTELSPLDRGLAALTRQESFGLVRWIAGALAERAWNSAFLRDDKDSTAAIARVRRYFALAEDVARLRSEHDRLEVSASGAQRDADLADVERQLAAIADERRALAPAVERTIGQQIEAALAKDGIRQRTIDAQARPDLPFLSVAITPGVAFKLGSAPQLLIVAPRDRIEVTGSVLLQPDLRVEQAESLENAVEGLNVSPLVTSIGGLAAYPAIIPEPGSLRGALTVISHEWVHHYLAFRPLGWTYFSSYAMRSVNETLADLVGQELGEQVWQEHYAQPTTTSTSTAQPRSQGPAAQSDFYDLMRETRVEVERYLAGGDVKGAEVYMRQRQAWLATQGYYIRRLNTAYLSLYGAYSGGANPYEQPLRDLRQKTGSLRGFLVAAATIDSVDAFDRVTGGRSQAAASPR